MCHHVNEPKNMVASDDILRSFWEQVHLATGQVPGVVETEIVATTVLLQSQPKVL
jgi:hypothetical protein